ESEKRAQIRLPAIYSGITRDGTDRYTRYRTRPEHRYFMVRLCTGIHCIADCDLLCTQMAAGRHGARQPDHIQLLLFWTRNICDSLPTHFLRKCFDENISHRIRSV